jgi:5-methylcytosine-specific restriction endonuclease McrA
MASANNDPIVTCIERTLELIAHGEVAAARVVLQTLDQGYAKDLRCARLMSAAGVKRENSIPVAQRAKRCSLTPKVKTTTFERDQYTCRFCGTKTIDLEVLKALSRYFPAEFPYDSAWKHGVSSLVYWTHSTSLEHVLPIARGGLDDISNYATTCYACNDARGDLLLEEIGWKDRLSSPVSWDGLRRYLTVLRELLQEATTPAHEAGSDALDSPEVDDSVTAPAPALHELRIGMFVRAVAVGKKQQRAYRVEEIGPTRVLMLREMWRSGGEWVESKRQVHAEIAAVLSVIAEVAPRQGDACE